MIVTLLPHLYLHMKHCFFWQHSVVSYVLCYAFCKRSQYSHKLEKVFLAMILYRETMSKLVSKIIISVLLF